jgi:hypothetical protein
MAEECPPMQDQLKISENKVDFDLKLLRNKIGQ